MLPDVRDPLFLLSCSAVPLAATPPSTCSTVADVGQTKTTSSVTTLTLRLLVCVFGFVGFCLILVLSTGLDEWNNDEEFADELLDVSNKFVAVKFTSILVKLLILFLCFRISAGKEIG